MAESSLVFFPKVDGKPVSDFLVGWSFVHGLLDEGLDGDIVEVDLSFFDESGPGYFGDFDSQSQLVLSVFEFGVEAKEFLSDDIIFFIQYLKLFHVCLFLVKGGPEG